MYYVVVPLKSILSGTGASRILTNPILAVLACLGLTACVHRLPEPMPTRATIQDTKGGCTYSTSNRILLDQLTTYLFDETEWRRPILPWFEVPFERIVLWTGTNAVATIDTGSNFMWTGKHRSKLKNSHYDTMRRIKSQMSLEWNTKRKPAASGSPLPLDYMNPGNLTFPLEEAEFLLNP